VTLTVGHIYRYHCCFIDPPKNKIGLCVNADPVWFFWFNTNARWHGFGQLPAEAADHPAALNRECFLDLSDVKGVSNAEMQTMIDWGMISDAFRNRIIGALEQPIGRLSTRQRALALDNLTATGAPAGPAA
jgi:hypothetical protein